MTDEPKAITRSALSFLSGTALSRISGLARDMSMAFFFGTSASIAAFLVALRFAILLRRLFGEGALLNGFIPYFEAKRSLDPKQGALFFRDVFFSISFLLILFIGSAELLLYFWIDSSPICYLIMLILPGVLFICLFGIFSGLLHCEKYFFLTGASPIAYNVIWLGAVWIFRDALPEQAAIGLSFSIALAFFCQWFMTVPKTFFFIGRHLSLKEWFQPHFFSLEIRTMLSSLTLGVIGVAAMQINTAVDTVFARYAALEGPAYLNYAIHLQQLPLALFGIAISSALLPPLSRAFQADDIFLSKQLLQTSISNALFFIFPCTAAIFVLGRVSVNLLFGRGDFTALSSFHTTHCLLGYGLGLAPMVLSLLLAPAFYAKKDFRTPTFISLVSIGLNLLFNFLLIVVAHFGAASLAYSTSFASMINAALLYQKLPVKITLTSSTWKSAYVSGFAAVLTYLVDLSFFSDPFPLYFHEQLLQFFTLFTIFVGFFILATRNELSACLGKKL